MQAILHIPSIAAIGGLTRQPAHIVGDEALLVMHDPSAEWLAYATVIGRVVNDAGQPAPLIAPEHQATYDRLWPRTPVTWTDEEGTHESTPPALFGCLGTPPAEPSVESVAAQKNAEINAWRLAANQSTFVYGGKAIACDPLSRSDLDGVMGQIALNGAYQEGFPLAWKAVDNSYVQLPDETAFAAFYLAMVAQGTTNFAHSQALKAQLAAIVADANMTDTEKNAAIRAIQW